MKKTLTYTIIIFGLSGLSILVLVFASAMQPSAKARSERSQHSITSIEPGQYRIDSFGRDSAWNEMVLLIKDWDEKIYVYLLPTENGKVTLPDRWWGWGYYHCSDFRPELDEAGRILKVGHIKCHDKETPEWGANLWAWSYNGNPLDNNGIQMYSPAFEITDGTLYINR